MEILHILTSLDFGGVESHMAIVNAHSDSSVFTHRFCAIGGGGQVFNELSAAGASVVALNQRVGIPSPGAILSLFHHLRRTRPCIVHLHGAEANFHGAVAARLARVPLVIAEEIGIPHHSKRAQLIFRHIYRRCDRIVAISKAVADSLVALGEASPERIEVIHNPFTPQLFHPIAPRQGGLRLGFVGRLEAVKNPLCAVEALALLREDGIDASLILVGEGSQRPLLERRIAALGLTEKVTLAGFQARPFGLLRDCHLYLQPSLTEGFGLSICEAMSAGIPVIASAVGGAPEIIEHCKTGWLLQEPSPIPLAALIREAAEMPAGDLEVLARRASAHVTGNFSPKSYLLACDRFYSSLMAERDIRWESKQ